MKKLHGFSLIRDGINDDVFLFRLQIIQTHFWLKRNEITKQITNWINEIDEVGDNSKANRTLSHGTMSLKVSFLIFMGRGGGGQNPCFFENDQFIVSKALLLKNS